VRKYLRKLILMCCSKCVGNSASQAADTPTGVDVVVEAADEGVSNVALAGLTTELTTLLAQTSLQIGGEDVALVTTPQFVYTNGDEETTCTCFLLVAVWWWW
jgi:hypothetical protein